MHYHRVIIAEKMHLGMILGGTKVLQAEGRIQRKNISKP